MTQRRAKYQVTQDAVLRAATSCFARLGYGATLADVALETSGMSKGGVYYHFPTKDALFRAVIGRLLAHNWHPALVMDVEAARLLLTAAERATRDAELHRIIADAVCEERREGLFGTAARVALGAST